MNIPQLCKIDLCKVEYAPKKFRRGMCQNHYSRFVRHGDPYYNHRDKIKITDHPLYHTYYGIKNRCQSKDGRDYPEYGGRGIKLSEEWSGKEGFKNFCNDMGLKPTPFHSIDRIDNNKGYSRENCRWATKTQQVMNRRTPKSNTSSFRGVHWDKVNLKWIASIGNNRKCIHLGRFATIEEAVSARMTAEDHYGY